MTVTIQCAPVKPEAFDFDRPTRNVPDSPDQLFTTSTSKAAERRERNAAFQKAADEKEQEYLSHKHSGPKGIFAKLRRPKAQKIPPKPEPVTQPVLPPYEEQCLRVHLDEAPESTRIVRCTNGLVHTLEAAYSDHLHLTLRPDDVWHAMLSQFSIYVQANEKALRHKFVAHEDKKQLVIQSPGTLETADFAAMAQEMSRLLEENVKDPDLRTWMIPNFTTTTPNDVTIASVTMMATLQKYFDYKFSLMCGIPSVTLLGTPADWQSIRARVDKFAEFGAEPTKWAALLRPVCDAFVACFDQRNLQESREFWSRVCHYKHVGSGSTFICGWVTIFTVWDDKGKWQGDGSARSQWALDSELEERYGQWPIIEDDNVAPACAEVPVIVEDNGTQHHTLMLAGLPGIRVGSNEQHESVISPVSGWAMFEIPTPEK